MEKARKHLFIASGIAFAAGVAVTLTTFALTFCPERDYARWHKHWRAEHPVVATVQPLPPHMRFDHRRPGDLRRPGHPGFHPRPEMKERFVKRLGLTDEQKAQIEQFRKEDMAKMAPLFEQMDELRKQADELRKENKARFESVLTPEQKEILQEIHKKRAERIKERRRGKWDGKRPGRPDKEMRAEAPAPAAAPAELPAPETAQGAAEAAPEAVPATTAAE